MGMSGLIRRMLYTFKNLSSSRMQGSSARICSLSSWIPAFAGMTSTLSFQPKQKKRKQLFYS